MEVILLQDVEKLGNKHDLVNVKPGYGRNYLVPQGKAVVANKGNKKAWEQRQYIEQLHKDRALDELRKVEDVLQGATIKIGAKVGTSGKIFGSVTTLQLADAIKKQKSVAVDRKLITINDEVKSLGTYTASINLHDEVKIDLNFEVVEE